MQRIRDEGVIRLGIAGERPYTYLEGGALIGATAAVHRAVFRRIGDNSTFPNNGGTLVQLARTAEFVELASALAPPGVPTLGWGHVERVVTDHPPRLVDVRVEHVRWGWVRLPGLSSVEYTGRVYIG